MKFLFDLFPVILFFAAFKYGEAHKDTAAALLDAVGLPGGFAADQAPLLLATVVVIVATALQIAWVKWRHGKVDAMLWVSLVLIVALGGLTLFLRDERFIKWKPTGLYWAFALALLGARYLFGRDLIRKMMEAQMHLPDALWTRLNLAWVCFFAFMGALNLWVAFSFPTEIWVDFKLFGGMGLMLLFVLGQGVWLARHATLEERS